MAEIIENYFEIQDGIIVGFHDYEIDPEILPSGTKMVKANLENPELFIGLEEKYLQSDIDTIVEKAKELEEKLTPSKGEIQKAGLKSILTDILISERLGEDTTVLQTKFDDLAIEYKTEANTPPMVYAGRSITIISSNKEVVLKGAATDKDGKIVAVKWSILTESSGKIKIAKPDQLTTKVTGLEIGIHVFRLTATDDKGASSYDDITVTVRPSEQGEIKVVPKSVNFPFTGGSREIKVISNSPWEVVESSGGVEFDKVAGSENEKLRITVGKNIENPKNGGVIFIRNTENQIARIIWSQVGGDDTRCFDLESDILMDNGRSKKLKNVKIGDELRTFSFETELPKGDEEFILLSDLMQNASKTSSRVVDFGTETVQEYRQITLVDGEVLNVTETHPLLASRNEEEVAWLLPDDLRSGTFLVDKKGKLIEIKSKKTIREPLEIGVLQLQDGDNYFVQGCLVHNAKVVRVQKRKPEEIEAKSFDRDDHIEK